MCVGSKVFSTVAEEFEAEHKALRKAQLEKRLVTNHDDSGSDDTTLDEEDLDEEEV